MLEGHRSNSPAILLISSLLELLLVTMLLKQKTRTQLH